MIDPLNLYEYRLALHVHSRYSDGSGTPMEIIREAQASGIDVVWLTDHNTLEAALVPGPGYYGHVLFLVGAEISPPQNHLLVFGVDRLPVSDMPWAEIVEQINRDQGLSFVAHPDDPGNPFLRLPSYRWTEQSVRGFTGLEVWNHISHWARHIRGLSTGLWAAFHPWWHIDRAPEENLRLWDRLGQTERVVGIGGVDAHAVPIGKRPLKRMVFSYRLSFQTIRTHVYTRTPLSGEWRVDQQLLLGAMRAGTVAIVNVREGTETGFRFWGESRGAVIPMGGGCPFFPDIRIRGVSPVPVHWEIYGNGTLDGMQEGTLLEYKVPRPGVWRVALVRPRSHRVWIYGNPIYLR